MNNNNISFQSTDHYFDGMDTLGVDSEQQIEDAYLMKDNGDISLTAYKAAFRVNVPLGEKVHIGAGIALNVMNIERDTKYIQRELFKKLGDDMNLEIRFVDHIPRTQRGKYKFLIQKLPIEFGAVG